MAGVRYFVIRNRVDQFGAGKNTMMEWGQPQNLSWLWALAAVFLVFWASSTRKRSQMRRFGETELVRRLVALFSPVKRLIKRALLLFSIFFIVLALAQPHFKMREIEVQRKGLDVMIAVDVSQSMLAKDIAPNRLEKAKLELTTLIEKLRQHRIGIVAFAGEAFIQCPLTLDKSAVKLFLTTLNPNLIPTPGTAIGSAIRVSAQAFTGQEKDFKAIILLTDGEDHQSDPMGAARRAQQEGIRIFTIGIGTPDGSTLPGGSVSESFKKDKQGRVVLSKLDEGLLRKIAELTGGAYWRSSRGEVEVDSLVREINRMGQKGLKSEKIIEYEENFQYFLIPAFLLLILELILSERMRSRA
jgi:Ca-activated chloride channel family protein